MGHSGAGNCQVRLPAVVECFGLGLHAGFPVLHQHWVNLLYSCLLPVQFFDLTRYVRFWHVLPNCDGCLYVMGESSFDLEFLHAVCPILKNGYLFSHFVI